MRNPSSLTESPRHAQVESRMHAFVSNGRSGIEFWGLWARGRSAVPALSKCSCLQASGDALTDVINYYTYCTSHTFDILYDSGGPQEYKQTDTQDPDTLEALTATVVIDTDDFNFGDPPTWNNLRGYDISPNISGTAVDWDKAPTRAGIIAALDSVNWTALWAGSVVDNSEFQYDRVQLSFTQSGRLPFGGTATGDLIGSFGGFGPKLLLSGAVGTVLAPFTQDGSSNSDGLGVNLVRAQIQIRNYRGTPISYFIVEEADVAAGVGFLGGNSQRVNTSLALADTKVVYRKVSEGTWTADRQIIQLPDAAMDGPQIIATSFGDRVRNGTNLYMVVGMTFEAWMASVRGPTWADYVFT